MKISNIVLPVLMLLISIHASAQQNITVGKSDSIKSLSWSVFSIKTKGDKLIKGKPTNIPDPEFYPIQYPSTVLHYNRNGQFIKKTDSNQKDTTYYNSENKKIKTVIIPNPQSSQDSITISYTYDLKGNLKMKKMQASAPKMDYSLDNNYYSFESITDKTYINYYLSKNDSTEHEKFENVKPRLNYYYRIFDEKNKLMAEKYLTTTKNPYPYQQDSVIHHTIYQYNKDNKIDQISKINSHINSIGKNYVSERTEQHTYLNKGLTHAIKHYFNKKLEREELFIYNPQATLIEYTNHWLNPNRTIQYIYNSSGDLTRYVFSKGNKVVRSISLEYSYNGKGHWITCIHYDKNKKAKYLVERNIEYY
jgi:hypothetical protein